MKPISGSGILNIIHKTLCYIDPRLMDHGKRVAYLVYKLLEKQGKYTQVQKRDICFLAMIHDIGAYKTEAMDQKIHFETDKVWPHSIYGYLFIKYFSPLKNLAPIVLFHHGSCTDLEGKDAILQELAQLLGIADQTDIYFMTEGRTWDSWMAYLNTIRDKRFYSDIVDRLAEVKDSIDPLMEWDSDPNIHKLMNDIPLTKEEIGSYLTMIVLGIDFRSYHTVTHTITTTCISRDLATLFQLDEDGVNEIRIGAMLHDLGKIGIPIEILEFPGRLCAEDMKIMCSHVDKTEDILGNNIESKIKNIALRHHEKLDGSGYPRGLVAADLTLGERIVAVADVVSALYGQRSYKEPFSKTATVDIILNMANQGLVDKDVVDMVIEHFEYIERKVVEMGLPVIEIYERINYEYFDLESSVPYVDSIYTDSVSAYFQGEKDYYEMYGIESNFVL